MSRPNCTGFRGVTKHRHKYGATGYIEGRAINIGYFYTAEEASAAYEEWILKNPKIEGHRVVETKEEEQPNAENYRIYEEISRRIINWLRD